MTVSQTLSDPPLVGPVADLAYLDIQSVRLPRAITPLEAWNLIMANPLPGLAMAFRLRDAISARFGVKRIGGFTGVAREAVAPGDRLDFFVVEAVAPDRMVLTERDRHLDVMVAVTCAGPVLTLTASVVTHNRFGRVYMAPVGLAHRWIVAAMLRRLARGLAAKPG